MLLVTETAAVVRNFSAACRARGWNCFWTAQQRLDLNIDPWNPMDPRNPHGAAQKAQLAAEQAAGAPGGGGSITAALLLKEFVKKAPWAHLDIAGPVWNEKAGGATGFGVRTLAAFTACVRKLKTRARGSVRVFFSF